MKKNILIIIALLLISLPSIFPLFHKGFFQSDDGEWMIIRFSAFYQALADGQFPARFLSRLNQEYGYPVANFLYPGFMYLAVPIKLLGFGFVETIKITMGIIMLESVIFAYLWLSKQFNKWTSLIGAFVYLYAPYHMYDLYKRGSVGELLALAVVPFILWQIERKSLLFASLGIALLILAHNTLALLFVPLIIIYSLIRAAQRFTLSTILLGLGISSFFWIPAIYDLQYTVFAQTKISDWHNYFVNVNLIGLVPLAVFLGTLIFFSNDSNHRSKTLALFMLGVGILGVILSLRISTLLWNILPVSFIQFPFRLLSLTLLSASFLAAFLLSNLRRKEQTVVGAIIILISFYIAQPFLAPSEYFDKGDGLYATNMDTTTVKNEYMPKWVSTIPTQRAEQKILSNNGTVRDVLIKTNKISFISESDRNTRISVQRVYFPGWNATVDKSPTKIDFNNLKGIMQLDIPDGKHTIMVEFSETPLRLASDIVSLVSFIFLIGLVGREKTLKIKK